MTSETPAQPNSLSPEALAARLQRGERLMGLDLGDKTIGLAISDVEHRIATSLKTLPRKKFTLDAQVLLALAADHKIAAFILGMPLNMDGSSGPRVQATRAFARSLAALTPVPILFWDERLSTVAAERVLIAADMSRKKRAAVIDSTAATFILQGFLDRLRHISAANHDES